MSRKKYHFTPEMDERIRELYRDKVGMKSVAYKGYVRDLAAKFGMPRYAVTQQAVRLGVLPVQKKEPVWTDEEIKILERNAHLSLPTIQKKLEQKGYSRTEIGINLKRKRMRLPQNLNGYSALSVALCFGIDTHTVIGWIEKGWLKAIKRGSKRTKAQGGDYWYIKNKWIRDFIKESVAVIDFRKVDKYWIVDLLAGGDY